MSDVARQADWEKRLKEFSAELGELSKKYLVGIRIIWQVPNGPIIGPVDLKNYEEEPNRTVRRAIAKKGKSAKSPRG